MAADGVTHDLGASGWNETDLRPIDVPCTLPENERVGYFTRLGPVGRILHEVDEQTRDRGVCAPA